MRKIVLIINLLVITLFAYGQKKVTLDGYLNDMQTIYHIDNYGWLWENQIHNRLNLNLYPAEWLTLSIQGRTRFINGNTVTAFSGYGSMTGKDAGMTDLSFAKENHYNDKVGSVFTSMIDRAYAELTFGNFVGTIGRQRINWSQTFVWNPNDIFNSYSYFDIDYSERPGSDAIRLQYYTGVASTIELAVKADSSGSVSAAGYYRSTLGGYDYQIIGGVLAEEDLVAGAGWSGFIGNVSFRGELSYFRDLKHFSDTSGNLLASAGLDYTFGESLWLQGEVLYSGFAKKRNISSFIQMFSADMNVKNIGFTEWSLFASLTYPVSPLINVNLAGMYYPLWKGFYLGPSFEFSVVENVAASLILQGFSAELEDPYGTISRQNTAIAYARLKYSF